MEATLQPKSLKVTIKLKRDKNVDGSSAAGAHSNNPEGERNASDNCGSPVTLNASSGGNQTSESPQLQLVLYDPAVTNASNSKNAPDRSTFATPVRRPHPFSDRTPRVLPSIGAFAVQCANCFKWRLVPTKEKYEEIREHILSQPFLCETAREWQPQMSCDDPPDITQDGSRLWAIDKPNIAQPPPGWQRLLRIRGEGSSKFADVYYVAPSGKTLRSMVEIQRYLNEHPEFMNEEVSLSRFSFQIPKPLQENYVRKPRPQRPALPPSEVARLTWVRTDVDTDLQLSMPTLANEHLEAAARSNPETQPGKRRRVLSPCRYNNDFTS